MSRVRTQGAELAVGVRGSRTAPVELKGWRRTERGLQVENTWYF